MVEVNILGSGSSLPLYKRFSPSQIIKIEGKNKYIKHMATIWKAANDYYKGVLYH